MKPTRSEALVVILLMQPDVAEAVMAIADRVDLQLEARQASSAGELAHAAAQPFALLLSHGTSVIVPKNILTRPGAIAINVHAASPAYPGRDPHHFAIYDGAKQYGATMHYMTNIVDAGPIVDVELFDVPRNTTPAKLLALANDAGLVLIRRFFQRYAEHGAPAPLKDAAWGPNKSTRKKFLEMCRVDASMPEAEFKRRLKATAMPGYRNLFVDIHGYRFRIEGPLE